MAQAASTASTFPAHTCRASDIGRVRFDDSRWSAIQIGGVLHLREDELEDMLDGAISSDEWFDRLRDSELVWVDTGSDERTFVRLDGVLRVALAHKSEILPGSAAGRFLEWANGESARQHRRPPAGPAFRVIQGGRG